MVLVVFFCMVKTFFFMRIFSEFSSIVRRLLNVIDQLGTFLAFYGILIMLFAMLFNVFGRNESPEYKPIGYFLGSVFYALRFSVADFDFSPALSKSPIQNAAFWVVWVSLTILSFFIILNFIIAQVTNVYEKLSEEIDALNAKERASLIAESEGIMFRWNKTGMSTVDPRYIIVREKEERSEEG